MDYNDSMVKPPRQHSRLHLFSKNQPNPPAVLLMKLPGFFNLHLQPPVATFHEKYAESAGTPWYPW